MFLTTNDLQNFEVCRDQADAGLTTAQVNAIERGLGNRYRVDQHGACEEGLALMISDTEADCPDTVLYVDVEPVGLSLSILSDEVLHHRGCFTSVDGLLSAIRALGKDVRFS